MTSDHNKETQKKKKKKKKKTLESEGKMEKCRERH